MVSFPRSSTSRNSGGHLRLISSVDLSAPAGLQLRGRFARPGSRIELAALPRPAVVLEHGGRLPDLRAADRGAQRADDRAGRLAVFGGFGVFFGSFAARGLKVFSVGE
jgi:hypothetical protein